MKFDHISSELWREYKFAAGAVVHIVNPLELNVSGSNGHRILDAAGVSHYIPWGWVHLSWKAKEGAPKFVK